MQPDRRDEYLACLALRNSNGLGPRTWKRILEHFGRAAVAVEHACQWQQLGVAHKNQVRDYLAGSWREATARESRAALEKDMEVLLWSDDDYPEILRQIPNPPVMLYLAGDRGLLGAPALAMVGSRKCSRYGLDSARTISRDVSRAGLCVVSGFAAGIDRQVHVAALSEVGSSIAVLGTGLDLLYPAANKDLWLQLLRKGLILSEFAPGTRPDAVNFPHRNRIISGLSLGVVVIEAVVRSGSLITAGIALEQGREVFALPGPVNVDNSSGCHQLIRQGAILVRSTEDILIELQPQLAAKCSGLCALDTRKGAAAPSPSRPPERGTLSGRLHGDAGPPAHRVQRARLNAEEAVLVAVLEQRDRMHIDEICEILSGEPAHVSSQLLLLEMRSLVMRHPGMYYSLCA